MYERNYSEPYVGPQVPYSTQGLAVITIIVAMLAAFAFVPARDPSKVIPGVACSVLSETEISSVVGTPVRLSPTTGTLCRYVATEASNERSVMVIATREVTPHPRVAYTVDVVEPSPQLASYEKSRLVALIPGHVAQR
jgi:hypothetical protein